MMSGKVPEVLLSKKVTPIGPGYSSVS